MGESKIILKISYSNALTPTEGTINNKQDFTIDRHNL